MLKKLFLGLIFLVLVLAIAFYFLFLRGSTQPHEGSLKHFPIDQYRALMDDRNLVTDFDQLIIGGGTMPGFAVQIGNFKPAHPLIFTSYRLRSKQGKIIIGGAVDETTVGNLDTDGTGFFNQDTYDILLQDMREADQILITHEHWDHIKAITKHPDPAIIAPKLRLNHAQLKYLPQQDKMGDKNSYIAPEILQSISYDYSQPTLVAPGVVVHQAPSHTAGTQVFFVKKQDGREFLLVGDIVWVMMNVDDLKTRPLITNFAGLDEDRRAILEMVAELSAIQRDYPEVTIVPSHDVPYLEGIEF